MALSCGNKIGSGERTDRTACVLLRRRTVHAYVAYNKKTYLVSPFVHVAGAAKAALGGPCCLAAGQTGQWLYTPACPFPCEGGWAATKKGTTMLRQCDAVTLMAVRL